MNIFAFYLPQFHRIPENDEWWGDGFTEWTNVRSARSLYRGHVQPKHPLDNNYYNLLDKRTVEWQTELMRLYGVDGLVYYHYYFVGKKLLEIPAENLLGWKDIPQRFFFCWANHTWYKAAGGKKIVLLSQEYGDCRDWENHFRYLLQFFLDERYEKRNNRPLMMLFNPCFPQKVDMFNYFDKRCKEEGFSGLCLIEAITRNNPNSHSDDDVMGYEKITFIREPLAATQDYYASSLMKRVQRNARNLLSKAGIVGAPRVIPGEALIKLATQNAVPDKSAWHGVWFEWDNTPRHGSRGYVITPYQKEQFFRYMDAISSDEYVVINAWNEWAEGMMLEPTVEEKYRYLEWISEWKTLRDY